MTAARVCRGGMISRYPCPDVFITDHHLSSQCPPVQETDSHNCRPYHPRSFKSQLQNSVIISGCYIFFQSLHSFLSRAHYKTTFGADTGLSDLVYAEVEVT